MPHPSESAPIAEPPARSALGWTLPLEIGRTSVELHKGGTLLSTFAATAILSAIATGTHTSPEGFNTTEHFTESQTVLSTRYHEETDYVRHLVPVKTEVPEHITDDHNFSFKVRMTDTAGFSLDGEGRVINSGQVDSQVSTIKRLTEQGYRVTSIDVNGTASDETQLDTRAGIGEHDAGNAHLAKEYGAYATQVVVNRLQAAGVAVPGAEVTTTSGEFLTDVSTFKALASAEGKKDILGLINAYKQDPSSLSAHTRAVLKQELDDNRGATVNIVARKTATMLLPKIVQVNEPLCVIKNETIETTERLHHHYYVNWALFALPIPILRFRRKNGPDDTEPELPEVDATPKALTPTDTQLPDPKRQFTLIKGVPEATDGPGTDPEPDPPEDPPVDEPNPPTDGPGGGTGDFEDRKRRLKQRRERRARHRISNGQLKAMRSMYNADENDVVARVMTKRLGFDSAKEFDDWASKRIMSRRIKGIGALLVVAAGLSTVRLDAGYCPDPQNHLKQSFRWSNLPDSLYIRFQIPFTDLKTGQTELIVSNCEQQAATPTVSPTSTSGSCSVQQIVIRDGHVLSK